MSRKQSGSSKRWIIGVVIVVLIFLVAFLLFVQPGWLRPRGTMATADELPRIESMDLPSQLMAGGQFNASAALKGTQPITTVWDFGDETAPKSGAEVYHTYSDAGDYIIMLTAMNAAGVVTDSYSIQVNEAIAESPSSLDTPGPTPPVSSLKYDETGCPEDNPYECLEGTGQREFVAIYVRNIQSGDRTLMAGIVAIQELFASVSGVQTWDAWETLDVDPVWPTLVWCPAGDCQFPPDSAFPLMGIRGLEHVQFTLAIISAHAPADPPAGITEVTCPGGDCWAGRLR